MPTDDDTSDALTREIIPPPQSVPPPPKQTRGKQSKPETASQYELEQPLESEQPPEQTGLGTGSLAFLPNVAVKIGEHTITTTQVIAVCVAFITMLVNNLIIDGETAKILTGICGIVVPVVWLVVDAVIHHSNSKVKAAEVLASSPTVTQADVDL